MHSGYFAITTLRGFVQTSALRDMFDKVDPEDKVLGDIIHKHYLEVKSQNIHWPDYVTSAWADIVAHSNEMPIPHRKPWQLGPDIEHYMGQVSWKLMTKYPLDWLRNAAENFVDTFTFTQGFWPKRDDLTIDHSPSIKNEATYTVLKTVEDVEYPFLSVIYVLTLFLSVGSALEIVIARFRKKQITTKNEAHVSGLVVTALGLATFGAFAGYTLFACYLPRYGASYVGGMIIFTGYTLDRWISLYYQKHLKTSTEEPRDQRQN